MGLHNPEDREPRDVVEPQQEPQALRYELTVRLAPPYSKRTLIVRHYEDGTVVCWIAGASMVNVRLK